MGRRRSTTPEARRRRIERDRERRGTMSKDTHAVKRLRERAVAADYPVQQLAAARNQIISGEATHLHDQDDGRQVWVCDLGFDCRRPVVFNPTSRQVVTVLPEPWPNDHKGTEGT